jgi:hypothetical protein
MPVISRTKIGHVGGSTMDALVVGESFSGRITIKTTKDIVFSYSTTDGTTTTEEGASGKNCYRVTHEPHTLHWKAKIHTRTEKTVRSVVKRFIHGVASDIENAGAVVTAAGGAIALYGVVTGPAETAVGPVGLAVAGIGSVLWGAGAFVRYLSEDETTVTETDKDDSGTKDFESVDVVQIECLPNHTYSAISLPTPKSASEAENEAVVQVLTALGF